MQRYTIFFITVNALRVSGGFSAHHQEFKNCTHSIWYVPGLLAATASGSSKQAWHILCNVASCWLYLKEYINDARSHEGENSTMKFMLCTGHQILSGWSNCTASKLRQLKSSAQWWHMYIWDKQQSMKDKTLLLPTVLNLTVNCTITQVLYSGVRQKEIKDATWDLEFT
jgi:hypothetical protein